ncbi:MAG: hypothetical protein HQL95_04120 [Magnetococcales bacterium]|nr:hypothetical protein [Magnetococcales bacterium]
MKRHDARYTLLAFGFLLPVLMSAPLSTLTWWSGCALVGVAVRTASLPWRWIGHGLMRLRWLFLAMLLTHGLMTPGEFLWPALPLLTREGVLAGVQQSLRLVLLAVLAWSLGRITTPMELVGALDFFLGWLERWRMPIRRGLALLGFCLTGLSRFKEQVERVREGMTIRLGQEKTPTRPGTRLERLAFAAGALLTGLLWDLRRREEGLRMRGFDAGLPAVVWSHTGEGHDWLLPLPSLALWIVWLAG